MEFESVGLETPQIEAQQLAACVAKSYTSRTGKGRKWKVESGKSKVDDE
jgi:hypothetical protein